jgi:hypothetical protein
MSFLNVKRAFLIKSLYFATGLATAFQLYWLMMWAIWGRQTRTIEYVAMLGSGVLILAATFWPTAKRMAHAVALIGAGLLWLVYGPGIGELFDPTSHWPEEWLGKLIIVGPLFLLTLSTFCSIFLVLRSTGLKDGLPAKSDHGART